MNDKEYIRDYIWNIIEHYKYFANEKQTYNNEDIIDILKDDEKLYLDKQVQNLVLSNIREYERYGI